MTGQQLSSLSHSEAHIFSEHAARRAELIQFGMRLLVENYIESSTPDLIERKYANTAMAAYDNLSSRPLMIENQNPSPLETCGLTYDVDDSGNLIYVDSSGQPFFVNGE